MKPPFFTRNYFIILVIFAFLGPLIFAGTRRSLRSNTNDVKSWLPPAFEETATFNWYWKQFPSDAFILVSWEGCTLDDERLQLLAQKLTPQPSKAEYTRNPKDEPPPFFSSVMTGAGLLQMLIEEQHVPRAEAIRRLQGIVIGPDGVSTCLILTVSHEVMDLSSIDAQAYRKFMHGAIDTIYATAETECAIPPQDLHMGGPPVDNVAIDVEGERSLLRLAGLSGIVGLLMSWLCLRSWKLTAIVFSSSALSAGLSLAAVWLTGSKMNAILLTMPALVYVAATSGAIHLANYYRDAVKTGGMLGAVDRAVRNSWLPLGLATGTTAIGLASLAVSELKPIQMFGIYSALGVMISFVVLCTLMPAALVAWPPAIKLAPEGEGLATRIYRNMADRIVRHAKLVTAASLLLMVVGAYGVTHVTTSVSMMRFFSPKAQIIQDYTWLEQKLGPLVPMEIVVRVDTTRCKLDMLGQVQLVSQVQKAVSAMDEVGGTLAAPTFAQQVPKRAGMVERATWNTMLDKNRAALRDYLSTDGNEELWRISARVPALDDIDYGAFVNNLRDVVEPILKSYRERGVDGLTAVYTGVIPVVYKAQHTMFDGLVFGFAGDLILIGIAMVCLTRNFSSGLLLILPSLFPLAVLFGAMGLGGFVVDSGTVMTPAVALGVTVDDAIHFMLWCRHGEQKGMTRRESILYAYDDCARAIYQSWGVIGLGLFSFALSTFMPTVRFGVLMLGMLTLSSIGNLIFLPALLASPLGHFFWSRKTRCGEVPVNASAEDAASATSPVPPPHFADAAHRVERD